MFLAAPTTLAPRRRFKFFVQLFAVCALLVQASHEVSPSAIQEGLRLELPDNGNLRVENLRGGVIIEIWNERYVSVTAISDRGEVSRSPAVVRRTDTLLSVRVTRTDA